MTEHPGQLLEFATDVARAAGQLLLEYQGERHALVTSSKSTPTDLVSAADRDSEALVRQRIVEAYPSDVIVGEESTRREGTSGRTWIVDPLDGTTNFLFGVPTWAVSIACDDEDGPLVACVLDPSRDEIFTATRSQATLVNSIPVSVSSRADLAHALVATGFNYDSELRRSQASQLAQVIGEVRDVRRGGAAALDLAWVAAGRFDGFYEAGLGWWDWAAGSLLVTAAGGSFVRAPSPHGVEQVVAANAVLGPELERLVTPRR